ncbi:MAG: TonB-dependent receptor [Chlorobiaceae bacterium]|nr:TonB-dependent receptor [Chlorobiaceae bacterium]
MHKKVFIALMAGLLSSKGLLAKESLAGFTGDEVVVTATKTMNALRHSEGSSVTVITAQEIKNSGQSTVEEVIKGSVGIDVVSNGGAGTSATLFLRGSDAKNTLLLIDGVPANDPSDANRSANFANLTVDNIERIEIVRGPVSFLYGSNASAGVINIITKTGSATPETFAGTEGGSYGTSKFYGGTNGRTALLNYSLGVSRLKTEGFSAVDEKNSWINPTGKAYDKDGYENTTLSAKFGLFLSGHISIESVLRYTKAAVALDSSGADRSGNELDSEQFNGRIALKLNYKPLISTFYYDVNNQDRLYLSAGTASSSYTGNFHELGWQGDLSLAENNTVSVGINSQHESLLNKNFGASPSTLDKGVSSNSIFLQEQWHPGLLNLAGGVRYEQIGKFGSRMTFRVAPSCSFNNTSVKFSYGSGFRAPSLYELYSPYGHEALKAETSSGWDAGVDQRITERFKFGSTWFTMHYDDRIAFDLTAYKYAQASGLTKTSGVENYAEWKPLDHIFLMLNYTYTHTEDPSGIELPRRPKNKVGLLGSWTFSKNSKISTNLQWVGSRKDAGARDALGNKTGTLSGYCLVNIAGSCSPMSQLELYGRIDNLFDRFYEESWGYATAGRSAYAGLKYKF